MVAVMEWKMRGTRSVGVGKPLDDCAGRCGCFAPDSAVARLARHLGASARWGAYSERRRKDVLRLQFAALTRLATPLTERHRQRLLALQREIASLEPLERTRQRESRTLRAFRRTLGGPAFRSAFEEWYKQAVDPTPLRAFIAEFSDDKTRPTHREVSLPDNGCPPRILTLPRAEQRTLVQAALAEVRAAIRQVADDRDEPPRCVLVKKLDEPTPRTRRDPYSLDFARDALAAFLGLTKDALVEIERGRQKPRRTTGHRAVRGCLKATRVREMDPDVVALGRLTYDRWNPGMGLRGDPVLALLARDALGEIGHAAIQQVLRRPRYGTLADLARPPRSQRRR